MISPRLRFIPACAGNSVSEASQLMRSSVHPRVCGEQFPHRFLQGWFGSSPRVRGTVESPSTKTRDIVEEVGKGSSPRVRGTDYLLCH